MIDADRRYLVLAAHADDETIALGGTIARLRQAGAAVSVAVATESTSTQYPDDPDARERRRRHFEAAMGVLGVEDFAFGSLPDMHLSSVPHIELNAWVAAHIARTRADTVLVHHPADVNLDHRRLYESTLVATRPTPASTVRSLYCYATGSASEWAFGVQTPSFVPQCFVDIEATLARKCAALECYEDELQPFPHPRSIEALRACAHHTGSIVGVRAAEAFQIVRSVD